jgi:hypothetical protein
VVEDLPLQRKVTPGEKWSWLEKELLEGQERQSSSESSVSRGQVSADPSFGG